MSKSCWTSAWLLILLFWAPYKSVVEAILDVPNGQKCIRDRRVDVSGLRWDGRVPRSHSCVVLYCLLIRLWNLGNVRGKEGEMKKPVFLQVGKRTNSKMSFNGRSSDFLNSECSNNTNTNMKKRLRLDCVKVKSPLCCNRKQETGFTQPILCFWSRVCISRLYKRAAHHLA